MNPALWRDSLLYPFPIELFIVLLLMPNKIVIAITGASGAIYPKLLIEKLLSIPEQWEELSVVMSKNAQVVWQTELNNTSYQNYPVKFYDKYDFNAPFASGSARYNIMIVAPCSMGTLGRIANGISDDVITRAADVVLKERRKLLLLARETPYNLIHIRNMEAVTLAGGIICPATPSFYSLPKTIEELAATVTDRVLDLAGLNISSYRWKS
ncbi:aromatic acid decarboxylase [Filimonas zeae]|uniref:Flavin prenyltransferase UbiX n=2 Tax=Filimonas zeae TaxID=1737353 RepID=A0A917IZS5_9BACT|nr:aromatic acid decarboxylase [Filimonas zeae]